MSNSSGFYERHTSNNPKVSIVIPTYNEKDNLEKLVKSILGVFETTKTNGNIIVADDNSPDGTGKIADRLSRTYPVIVIHRIQNRGYGNSVIDGFKKAIEVRSDAVLTMDCDLSHDPEVIPIMVQALQNGNDVVIGSRRVHGGKIVGWNLWRHFCSSGAGWFSRFMLGLKTRDITSGFRAYKIEVLREIPFQKIKSNGYSFLEELLYMVELRKYRIKEVPIIFFDRTHGESKLSKKEIVKFFATIFRLRFNRGHYNEKNI